MSRLGGIILAAGLSTRMGQFKPLMKVDGKSMLRHVFDHMQEAGAETIVVVTGHRCGEIEAELADSGALFVRNPDYAHTQQLESLRCGLSVIGSRADRILISPADVPLFSQETVSALLALSGDFIRPMYHGEAGHPVVLSAELIPMLMTYDGPGGLRGAVESSGCTLTELSVTDRGTVLDNDTPEDFARLMAYRSTIK